MPIVTSFEEADQSEVAPSLNTVIRGTNALQRRLRDYSRKELFIKSNTNYKLHIEAAIVSARGIVELAQVKIDRGSL